MVATAAMAPWMAATASSASVAGGRGKQGGVGLGCAGLLDRWAGWPKGGGFVLFLFYFLLFSFYMFI